MGLGGQRRVGRVPERGGWKGHGGDDGGGHGAREERQARRGWSWQFRPCPLRWASGPLLSASPGSSRISQPSLAWATCSYGRHSHSLSSSIDGAPLPTPHLLVCSFLSPKPRDGMMNPDINWGAVYRNQAACTDWVRSSVFSAPLFRVRCCLLVWAEGRSLAYRADAAGWPERKREG